MKLTAKVFESRGLVRILFEGQKIDVRLGKLSRSGIADSFWYFLEIETERALSSITLHPMGAVNTIRIGIEE